MAWGSGQQGVVGGMRIEGDSGWHGDRRWHGTVGG